MVIRRYVHAMTKFKMRAIMSAVCFLSQVILFRKYSLENISTASQFYPKDFSFDLKQLLLDCHCLL